MLGQWQCDNGHRHTSASRETECWGHFLLHHWFSCKYLGNCTLVKQSPFYLLQGYALELKYYAHMLMLVPWHPIYLNVVVVLPIGGNTCLNTWWEREDSGSFTKMPCIRFREWNPNSSKFWESSRPEPPLPKLLESKHVMENVLLSKVSLVGEY
jgi:hypothetical protein